MKLSQLGHAPVAWNEPVRHLDKNGLIAVARKGKHLPFSIRWEDGSSVEYQADDPVLGEIDYCPYMNVGQEVAIRVLAAGTTPDETLQMFGCLLGQMGACAELQNWFSDWLSYQEI